MSFNQIFDSHTADRSGQICFLDGAIAYNHNLVQTLYVRLQLNINDGTAIDADLLGCIADKRKHQEIVFIRYVNRIIAFGVSYISCFGKFDKDVFSRDRLSVVRGDLSSDRDLLGVS